MRSLYRRRSVWFALSALQFLVSVSLSASQLTVSWSDNSTNEDGFKIERATNGGTFAQLASVGANVTSYADTTVVQGASYEYRVAAYQSSVTSAYSNVAAATVSATTIAPAITTQPTSKAVVAGSSVSFVVAASGSPTPSYQWYKNNVLIAGATSATLSFASVASADAASYTAVASNTAGSATSAAALLTIKVAPAFTTQPVSKSVSSGSSVTFTVAASGIPVPTLQWYKNGVAISGATSSSYSLTNVTSANAANYAAIATNSAGSATSNTATLTVTGSAPSISTQPSPQSVLTGGTASFSVTVSGSPAPTLQWFKDGVALSGATASTLTLTNVSAANGGNYSLKATNSIGSAASQNASLTVTSPIVTVPGKLVRVSSQAVSAPWGAGALRMDFTVAASAKSILIRAIGPALDPYTTATLINDPKITLDRNGTPVANNDNWGGSTTLSTLFTQLGAFPLAAASKDAALVTSLTPASYTAVLGARAGGMAMAEIYDADSSTTSSGRLQKVLARGSVGKGEAVMVTGFTISGDTPVRLLIRAVGPSLQGLQGVLSNPQLDLYRGSALLNHNDSWGGTTALSSLFAQVGAQSLGLKSRDAAIDVTLAPGSYTGVISGVNGMTGLARFELYVVP